MSHFSRTGNFLPLEQPEEINLDPVPNILTCQYCGDKISEGDTCDDCKLIEEEEDKKYGRDQATGLRKLVAEKEAEDEIEHARRTT